MARTVLVTGASGLLGRDVVKAFDRKDWKVVGTGLTRTNPPSLVKLDLLDEKNIESVLDEVKPDVIVHCAANRFPDSCSNDPEAAKALNVSSTRTLTSLAKSRNAFLIYISTDYVFPGHKGEAPYKTTDKTQPPNVYGQTKLDGEHAVLSETSDDKDGDRLRAVVLRVPVLYGHCEDDEANKSAIHPMIDAVYKAQKVGDGDAKVKVDDWSLRFPTATEDVGRVAADISDLYLNSTTDKQGKRLPQVLQFSGQKQYTKYEIAKLFGEEILGLPTTNIEPHDPSLEEQKPGDTPRPYNTQLDVSVLRDLGIDVSNTDFEAWWRRDLRAFRH